MRAGVREADLKDASQEVFIIVASKLGQFDEATKMTTWLYGIAVRVAANHRRKVQRKREDLVDSPDETIRAGEDEGPEQRTFRAEALAQLAELLDSLPPDQRVVFELFELEEMSCPAIADALAVPLGTVYTRLRAARATLAVRAQGLTHEANA